jgi:beta-arabinofuranosyltransferase
MACRFIVWAWNTRGPRLFGPVMPHFIFGRGKYDNWMTHEAISYNKRQVIDASETILLVHVRHDYHLVSGNTDAVVPGTSNELSSANGRSREVKNGRALLGTQFWSEGKMSKFELFINIYLSLHVGTYTNQKGSVLYAPWKLGRCAEPSGMCTTRRKRPGNCPCEYSSYTSATQTDPVVKEGSRVVRCGLLSSENKDSFAIPMADAASQAEPESFGLPLTLRGVTNKVQENNTIILTALTFGYRAIMMNWVCNLRELGIENFVIASLDPDLYKYAYTRGLPTYYENTVTPGGATVNADAAYGTNTFKEITKAKSRVVLRFLKLGYNVVWSDCDIIIFKNPILHLWNQNADLAIQSNAPDNENLNGARRLNSGFYLAKSSPKLIHAFEDVIEYARQSSMSEQPCFYDVLCGKAGQNAVGNDKCKYKDVMVQVLPRELYPNGVTNKIWDTEPGRIKHKFPRLYILHNNWIKGSEDKRHRFMRHRMITFSPSTELCSYTSLVMDR